MTQETEEAVDKAIKRMELLQSNRNLEMINEYAGIRLKQITVRNMEEIIKKRSGKQY